MKSLIKLLLIELAVGLAACSKNQPIEKPQTAAPEEATNMVSAQPRLKRPAELTVFEKDFSKLNHYGLEIHRFIADWKSGFYEWKTSHEY